MPATINGLITAIIIGKNAIDPVYYVVGKI